MSSKKGSTVYIYQQHVRLLSFPHPHHHCRHYQSVFLSFARLRDEQYLVAVLIAFFDFFFFLFFCFSFFGFLGPHPQHMEVPRLDVESELQLPVYVTATATLDP